jgi:hypothetical protein
LRASIRAAIEDRANPSIRSTRRFWAARYRAMNASP